MCGIVAVVSRPGRFAESDVRRSIQSLRHRGPDGDGVALVHRSERWEVWFAHARLAVVDLSSAASQPMVREGKGAIVFNGEVYGHQSLRRAVPDWEFRSRSDTETLLARVLEDPHSALVDANAMLAMAVMDPPQQRLILARDRLGKKPLFLYRSADVLAVASELKAFAALGLPLTLDPTARAQFRWMSYVPAPRTIWSECTKFPAASLAKVDLRRDQLTLDSRTYWDPLAGFGRTFGGSYRDAQAELDGLLADATRIRLEADVPVGLFLSGGIDSSLVASYVAATNRRDVRAFVVASDDQKFDESQRAVKTARRLGLPLEVIHASRAARPETLEFLTWFYDEPHATQSQLGILEMSAAAKEHATVVLTGDGGDEIFLGYPWSRYPSLLAVPRRVLRKVPGAVWALGRARRQPWLGLVSKASALAGLNPNSTERKLRMLAAASELVLDADVYELFQTARLREDMSEDDQALIGSVPLLAKLRSTYPDYSWDAVMSRGSTECAGAIDLITYLRDDVLQKVDRGTMAHGLEARSPLLDYRIVEFGQSLPTDYKTSGRVHKRILRHLAARRIDKDISLLPKRGFFVQSPVHRAPNPMLAWCDYVEEAWMRRWVP